MTRLFYRMLVLLGLTFVSACELADDFTPKSAPETQAIASATPQAISARLSNTSHNRYLVNAGDTLSVSVFENPELSQTVTVGPDGSFRYPLVGEVRTNGRTLRQIEQALTAGLGRTVVDPQVSVTLSELQGHRIYIDGEVVQPGEFLIDGRVTLVQAIALAGGFTAFADRRRVILYNPNRTGEKRILFNYEHFLLTGDVPDIFLLPGDTVIVR